MFRQILSNGDLIQLEPSWFGFGAWKPHRNLSEEVRLLQELEDKAKAKFLDLAQKNVIASANVESQKETLQMLLLENSEAYFEVSIDNSILEKREGVRYNYARNSGNNKQGNASSNKDKQNASDKQGGNDNNKKGRVLSIGDLLGAKLVLH